MSARRLWGLLRPWELTMNGRLRFCTKFHYIILWRLENEIYYELSPWVSFSLVSSSSALPLCARIVPRDCFVLKWSCSYTLTRSCKGSVLNNQDYANKYECLFFKCASCTFPSVHYETKDSCFKSQWAWLMNPVTQRCRSLHNNLWTVVLHWQRSDRKCKYQRPTKAFCELLPHIQVLSLVAEQKCFWSKTWGRCVLRWQWILHGKSPETQFGFLMWMM